MVATINETYPDLNIPCHSRWRHFQAGGISRWDKIERRLDHYSRDEIARIRIELAIVSVLLDAGAGDAWTYRDLGTNNNYVRSEGLAVASLALYHRGALSAYPEQPLRVDGQVLSQIDTQTLADAFQVTESNPLLGIDGRASLLRAAGACVMGQPEVFGSDKPRLGAFYDYLLRDSTRCQVAARDILTSVLTIFASIWPGRNHLAGENLGDIWHHDAVRRSDCSDRLVPFHKLSQWLTYSLVEPLSDAGIEVTGLEALTGLAEYRNGGLFVDLDVLTLRAPVTSEFVVDSPLIVEWRALTVALLDRLAPMVRERLRMNESQLPLARLLQGGTWSAGRRVASERRADASPPLRIHSDGTVF